MKKPSYEELESALEKVTAIAHFGGLAEMSALDALKAIRHATLPYSFDQLVDKGEAVIKATIEWSKP